jgi:hypothetical protein
MRRGKMVGLAGDDTMRGGGGRYKARQSGGKLQGKRGGTRTRVVDGFWWQLRTTRYGIGRGMIEEVKGYV